MKLKLESWQVRLVLEINGIKHEDVVLRGFPFKRRFIAQRNYNNNKTYLQINNILVPFLHCHNVAVANLHSINRFLHVFEIA